jgi:hypothetical protein
MRSAWFFLTASLLLAACKRQEHETVAPEASRELAANFPLLPMIEKSLWSQLLKAEEKQSIAPESEREAANRVIDGLAAKLRERHPFRVVGDHLELGGIVCDKAQGRFTIPARVEYPDPGDGRHPGEVELLLCSEAGRLHETLFVTDARPLHLELLLHLSGHAKGANGARFRIDVITAEGARIPVDSLVRASDGEPLPSPLSWEFSGSDFNDLYPPDLSGDFAIFWHAHDSILRITHQGIASGEVKLEPVPHSGLKDGDPVMLELVPIGR